VPLFTLGELLKQEVNVEYIVPPFLTKGGTMLLAAPNKSMKTFLSLHMASAIASGQTFIDMPTQQAKVLYIDYELGIAEAKKRLHPMLNSFPGAEHNLIVRTMDEKPLSLDPGTVATSNLFELLDDVRPAVVFFDTLRMSTSGEENSSTDMMKVFSRLRDLKIKFGFTPVVIHHMGKEPSEQNTAPRTSRGSSVVEDSPDTIGYITKFVTDANDPPKLGIRWKFRNHAPIPDSRFTFDARTGLFVRSVAGTKKVKNEPATRTAVESIDVTDGLLPAVRD
jgi:RecA-family ATPase